MRRSLIVLCLILPALAQTPKLPDAAKQKVLADYRLVVIKQTTLDTLRNNLCAANKDCLEAAKQVNAANDALAKTVKEEIKAAALPEGTLLNIDSDKGEVTATLPEKKAEKK